MFRFLAKFPPVPRLLIFIFKSKDHTLSFIIIIPPRNQQQLVKPDTNKCNVQVILCVK